MVKQKHLNNLQYDKQRNKIRQITSGLILTNSKLFRSLRPLSDHWRKEGSTVLTGSQIVALHETTLDWCLVALGKT